MSDLTDFLLARFDDDEAAARESGADAMVGWRWKHYPPEAYEEVQALTLTHSARVLAECDAKRRIVEAYRELRSNRDARQAASARAIEDDVAAAERRLAAARCRGIEISVELLALPYADHPDYDEAWKP